MARPTRQVEGRLEILEAAAVVLAKSGFHGMSMRDLAKALGKTATGFYNYYPSKEDLLFDLQQRAFETLVASAERATAQADTPADRLYAFILQHVQYVETNHAVMQVLIQEARALPGKHRRKIHRMKERYYAIGRELVTALVGVNTCAGPGQGMALDEKELERQTYALFGMLNWTYGWYRPSEHGTPGELARTLHRLMLCGLRPDCPVHPDVSRLDDKLSKLTQASLLRVMS